MWIVSVIYRNGMEALYGPFLDQRVAIAYSKKPLSEPDVEKTIVHPLMPRECLE